MIHLTPARVIGWSVAAVVASFAAGAVLIAAMLVVSALTGGL